MFIVENSAVAISHPSEEIPRHGDRARESPGKSKRLTGRAREEMARLLPIQMAAGNAETITKLRGGI
jgi:hypothetical protein